MPRGRTYVRNGSIVHLDVLPCEALAFVSGSELYEVKLRIKPLPAARWKALCAACVGSIGSLIELLRGDLDESVMAKVGGAETGLFPTSQEIEFDCSCPDYARMCKHVGAVLYGIGVRFDDDPAIFFRLRNVSASELVAGAAEGLTRSTPAPAAGRTLAQADVAEVFGIDVGGGAGPLPGDASQVPLGGQPVPNPRSGSKAGTTAKRTTRADAKASTNSIAGARASGAAKPREAGAADVRAGAGPVPRRGRSLRRPNP